jgi:hypothetical protein
VRERARLYWQTIRFHRATPPDWLAAERQIRADDSAASNSHANP